MRVASGTSPMPDLSVMSRFPRSIVHLMNDTANRGMLYGASCKGCSDAKWKIQRKLMDQ
jgi:hypothetical protein